MIAQMKNLNHWVRRYICRTVPESNFKKTEKKLKDQSSMSKIQIEKCHKANRAIDKNKHTLGTHRQEIQDPIYKLKKIKR